MGCLRRAALASSLADLVQHKTHQLAPFIRAARAAITTHALHSTSVRCAHPYPDVYSDKCTGTEGWSVWVGVRND